MQGCEKIKGTNLSEGQGRRTCDQQHAGYDEYWAVMVRMSAICEERNKNADILFKDLTTPS